MGMLMAGLGMMMSAMGSIWAGQQQADMARYNAAVSRAQADSLKKHGDLVYKRKQKEKQYMLGKQTALYAKSGIVLDSVSPILVMEDTAYEYELDAQIERYNYYSEAARYENEAGMAEYRAQTYERAGYMKAGATLLTGGAQMMSSSSGGGGGFSMWGGGYGN